MSYKPAYLKGRGRGRGTSASDPVVGAQNGNRGGNRAAGFSGSVNNVGREKQIAFSSVSNVAQGNEPSVLERGRGRGRGQTDAYASKIKCGMPKNGRHDGSGDSAEVKFAAISSSHQEVIKKYLENDNLMIDSSDDEDDIGDSVLQTIFKSYSDNFENTENVSEAQEDLLHSFRSGTSACLICIETVKKQDAIWNCSGCCAMFHIQCIQKWVKEGVYQHVYRSGDNETVDTRTIPWYCPKCRAEYKQSDCPNRYYCFCGKEQDPKFDPWLVPHSCGQTCGRELKPKCGHQCLLLCHPGFCPPCPKTVKSECYCGRQDPQIRRCSAQTWSCGQNCRKLMSCKQHSCKQTCHRGECKPCTKTSRQRCLCGKQVDFRPCATPQWQCEQKCNRALSCGHHSCEKICHDGDCGACPRSGPRSCPCGKTEYNLPCTEDVPNCGDTCEKNLDCDIHVCLQRCHAGSCGSCRQMRKKTCRCGQRQKEVLCCKEFLCDLRCSNMRNCGKHQCKRKCCDGNCLPCEQMCDKFLGCRNHKCQSRCHRGRCYPCPLTVDIHCRCKMTSVTVPCGNEKATKPPRCNQKCKIPPDCHHAARNTHRCHFGNCPPCQQTCKKKLEKCDHPCTVICHTAVRIKVKDNIQRAGPWESAPAVREEIVDKPCPPCCVPLPMQCLGEHEMTDMPCAKLRPYSCHRTCERFLSCGNHKCSLACHKVENAKDKLTAGTGCQPCEFQCKRPRPPGCAHKCLLTCHPDPCPPCKQMIRMRCHCEVTVCHIACHQWNGASQKERNLKQSCGGTCPKNLPCGHTCASTCHADKCPNSERCEQKVKVKCKCKRKKKEFLCRVVQSGKALLECDDVCEKENAKKIKMQKEAEREKKEEEQRIQQAELEVYERKLKGRKRKPRKQKEEVEDESFWKRYRIFIVISLLLSIVIGFFVYLMKQ